MRLICINYAETLAAARLASETATTRKPDRVLRCIAFKERELRALPVDEALLEHLMDRRPEHAAIRKYKK